MREARREGAGRLGARSRRRSACASTRGSAARRRTSRCGSSGPISTSSRELAEQAERDHARRRRRRRSARRAADRAAAAARSTVDRARGRARRAHAGRRDRGGARSGSSARRSSEVWVGQRRFDLVVRLAEDHRARRRGARARCSSTATTARASRSASSRAIEQTFGPGAIQREAGSRRIAVEASVAGRDLGCDGARRARARSRASSQLPPGYFVDVGGRVESQARAQRSLLRRDRRRDRSRVFLLLYLALGSVAETLVILATLPDRVRRRHRRAAGRRRDVERVVARRADRPVRHRRPERPRAGHADARRCVAEGQAVRRRRCARRASAACGRSS